MLGEKNEQKYQPPIFEIDISKGWDTVAQTEIFLKKLRKLPIYKKNLLYSGFDASDIGTSSSSRELKGIVYCGDEQDIMSGSEHETENPFQYALEYEFPAIAVYDPSKLEKANEANVGNIMGYEIIEPRAVLGIIRLKS